MRYELYSLFRKPGVAQYFYHILRTPNQRKHAIRWLKTLNPNYMLEKGIPWIVFDAIDFLEDYLPKHIKVFEYGSGSSTFFWRKFNAKCTSIEHDPKWFKNVNQCLKNIPSYKPDYRLVLPDARKQSKSVTHVDGSFPDLYLSNDVKFAGYQFQNYVSQIDAFPDNNFDVVLVDGRARPSCIAHSSSKVRVKGLLILDNAERDYYTTQISHLFANFKCITFDSVGPINQHPWKTNIYIRQS